MELELFFSEDNSISGKPEMRTRKLNKMMNESLELQNHVQCKSSVGEARVCSYTKMLFIYLKLK